MIMAAGNRGARVRIGLAVVAVLLAGAYAGKARAGTYIVAQCSPGVNTKAADAAFDRSSYHYVPRAQCNEGRSGLQIAHALNGGTGTLGGAYGRWYWRAPAGTYITGGGVFGNLRNDDSNVASLVLTQDAGKPVVAGAGDSSGVARTFGLPTGNWRTFLVQLVCSLSSPQRCGAGVNAHANVKQIRLQLADVAPPSQTLGGTMFSGAVLRGPQTIGVTAVDQGAGIGLAVILVNGQVVISEPQSCNSLPGGLTSRLQPCALLLQHGYTLDTALKPFRNGTNVVQVCVFDYAQTGNPNSDCDTNSVLVNNQCPGSSVAGGRSVTAGFAGTGRAVRRTGFGQRSEIKGRVEDAQGNGLPDALVCVQVAERRSHGAFKLVATTRTNAAGGWSFKLSRGPSRRMRIAYRDSAFEASTELNLLVRSRATLHLSRRMTQSGRKVDFRGRIPGPRAGRRIVVIHGTVPGSKRVFLIRRARTNALGGFKATYRFAPVSGPTNFVFWAEVPAQRGYPYVRGRSPNRYVRVSPSR